MTYLEKLLSSAEPSISDDIPELSKEIRLLAGSLANDLLKMLCQHNGFYALNKALHVFSANSSKNEFGIHDWNREGLWRNEYKELAEGCLFFAEDIFGGQFCIKDNQINTFDPETGDLFFIANNIEEWAKEIISDYEVLTGYRLASQWQEKNGEIPSKIRLSPKIPFVAGGEFNLGNLYAVDAVQGMRFRAHIANQIKGLPDGSHIDFKITE